jgi:hypothetical protein
MRSVSPVVIASLLGLSAACAPDGSSAYVSYNVPLTASCTAQADSDIFLGAGIWDVGSADTPTSCVHSYMMSLVVNSNLKSNAMASTGRAEPNVLSVTHADIRIMRKDGATLQFLNAQKEVDANRPNPYRVRTAASINPTTSEVAQTGMVGVEAVPRAYASGLTEYAGDSILLEIQLFGTTTGDVDVDFRPFQFPISICQGCNSYCSGDVTAAELSDLRAGKCEKDSLGGQDGMICVGDC